MIRARNLFLALSLALVSSATGNALGEEPQEPATNEEQIKALKPSADESSEREELGIPPDVADGPAEVYGGDLWSRSTPRDRPTSMSPVGSGVNLGRRAL